MFAYKEMQLKCRVFNRLSHRCHGVGGICRGNVFVCDLVGYYFLVFSF